MRPDDPQRYWLASSLLRVFPAVVAFVCLAGYAVASAWPGPKRGAENVGCRAGRFSLSSFIATLMRRCGPGLAHGALAAAALGIVLAAAYGTSPKRLWKTPDRWTRLDWIVHGEEMTRQDGLPTKLNCLIHRELARCYSPLDPEAALNHYTSAIHARRDPSTAIEMGDVLVHYGRTWKPNGAMARLPRPIPKTNSSAAG